MKTNKTSKTKVQTPVLTPEQKAQVLGDSISKASVYYTRQTTGQGARIRAGIQAAKIKREADLSASVARQEGLAFLKAGQSHFPPYRPYTRREKRMGFKVTMANYHRDPEFWLPYIVMAALQGRINWDDSTNLELFLQLV